MPINYVQLKWNLAISPARVAICVFPIIIGIARPIYKKSKCLYFQYMDTFYIFRNKRAYTDFEQSWPFRVV